MSVKNVKNWLSIAKQEGIRTRNMSMTPEISICCNLVSIPYEDTVAFSIAFMRNFELQNNVIKPLDFPPLMDIFENTMNYLKETYPEYYKPGHFMRITDKWTGIFKCQRLFFIPENTVASLIMTLFTKENVQAIKTHGVREIYLVVNTTEYEYNSQF